VQIVCSRPKADLLSIWIPILPEHMWKNVNPQLAGKSYAVKLPLVGTGPFQCVAFKQGEYAEMVANKQYFRGAPHIDEIIFENYTSADTMAQDLLGGTIDAAQGVPPAQFGAVSRTPGLTAVAYNYRNWDYLSMNCYTQPASKGNPVLKDARFRQALNWAIDRQKLVALAWSGRAQVGTTILPPGEWVHPDYHWQPPADTAYGYDPQKAAQLLDEAGFRDTDGNSVREAHGKPIVLRLWADSASVENQSEAKLIAGYLKKVGLGIRLTIMDGGAMTDRVWNSSGNTYAPDFDLYVWAWEGYFDPGQTMASFTTAQIGGWNEPCWSNAEYDRLAAQQAVTVDSTKRQQIIWRMQQIMYAESPEIVLTYPRYLQAYDSGGWTGWTRIFNGTGPAFAMGFPETYLNLRPIAASATHGRSTLWIAVVALAAAAFVGLVLWLVLRARRKLVEE